MSVRSTPALVEASRPRTAFAMRPVDVGDRVQDALAVVPIGLGVAQLERLVLAGGRPAGDGRPPERAVIEGDVDLDGGVPSRIEDLAGGDVLDQRHGRPMVPDVRAPSGGSAVGLPAGDFVNWR